jgi:AcrR family transcriptional regulator
MEMEAKNVDPRVKRTRKLLQHAFMELMREKDFAGISILDITERATVNRATFYAHFPDKYALMDSIIREQFQQVAASQLSSMPRWGEASLRMLIRATFEFLRELHNYCKPSEASFDLLTERAVQQELVQIILSWLKQIKGLTIQQRTLLETVASAMGWAIFGIAAEWSHGGQKPSIEEITNQVFLVLAEGAMRLVPGLLAEERA